MATPDDDQPTGDRPTGDRPAGGHVDGGLGADEIAALAHALNNPLAVVTMTADLIGTDARRLRSGLDTGASSDELRHGLDDIAEAADHLTRASEQLADIVRRLRAGEAPR